MTEAPREIMTWDELGAGARSLAEAVGEDGFEPDLVLGIARGDGRRVVALRTDDVWQVEGVKIGRAHV